MRNRSLSSPTRVVCGFPAGRRVRRVYRHRRIAVGKPRSGSGSDQTASYRGNHGGVPQRARRRRGAHGHREALPADPLRPCRTAAAAPRVVRVRLPSGRLAAGCSAYREDRISGGEKVVPGSASRITVKARTPRHPSVDPAPVHVRSQSPLLRVARPPVRRQPRPTTALPNPVTEPLSIAVAAPEWKLEAYCWRTWRKQIKTHRGGRLPCGSTDSPRGDLFVKRYWGAAFQQSSTRGEGADRQPVVHARSLLVAQLSKSPRLPGAALENIYRELSRTLTQAAASVQRRSRRSDPGCQVAHRRSQLRLSPPSCRLLGWQQLGGSRSEQATQGAEPGAGPASSPPLVAILWARTPGRLKRQQPSFGGSRPPTTLPTLPTGSGLVPNELQRQQPAGGASWTGRLPDPQVARAVYMQGHHHHLRTGPRAGGAACHTLLAHCSCAKKAQWTIPHAGQRPASSTPQQALPTLQPWQGSSTRCSAGMGPVVAGGARCSHRTGAGGGTRRPS